MTTLRAFISPQPKSALAPYLRTTEAITERAEELNPRAQDYSMAATEKTLEIAKQIRGLRLLSIAT